MFNQKPRWSLPISLKLYQGLADRFPRDRVLRYNWGRSKSGFSIEEIDAIYAEVIDKIPSGSIRVLEVGCGGGHFAAALKSARPDVQYTGIDLVVENVEAAKALVPGETFEVGNVFEYLYTTEPVWDFVVSIHCIFSCTDTKDPGLLLSLLDANAPQGFLVVGASAEVRGLRNRMSVVVSQSEGVTDSYVTGPRDFLSDKDLKNVLAPLLVVRGSTPAVQPSTLPSRYRIFDGGLYNEVREGQKVRRSLRAGGGVPDEITRVVVVDGKVKNTEAVSVEPGKYANSKVTPKRGES